MKIIKVMFLLSLCWSILSGCQNTIHGFGKDLEQTGTEIQKSTN